MNNHTNESIREDDLWQATLYLLGEGTDAERMRFEDRLGFDETLRAALIEATRLVELTTEGIEAPRSPDRMATEGTAAASSRWHVRYRAAAILGTAGAVLLTLGLVRSSSPASLSDAESDAELVTQMLRSHSEDDTQELETGLSDWSDDLETPAWLVTAIELDESADSATKSVPATDDSSI